MVPISLVECGAAETSKQRVYFVLTGYHRCQQLLRFFLHSLLPIMMVFVTLMSTPLYAAGEELPPQPVPDAQQVLTRIADQVDQLAGLVGAIAYILGLSFMIAGLMKLKHVGEQRSMMSQHGGAGGALLYLVVGALLLFLPTTWQYVSSTFWSTPCTFCYPTDDNPFNAFFTVVYRVVGFVGLLAFVRGLVILSHTGEQSQHGTFARAMTHIIGGILCMNMYTFVQTVFATLGIKL